MKCPSCNEDMEPLVSGIFQCPQCKKIIKQQEEEKKIKKKEDLIGNIIEGDWFHSHASLNKQYEIAESGIIISKTPKRMIAALICHTPYLKTSKYIRLSWWKKEIYQHGGFFKITEYQVLKNLIIALEKIDSNFDDFWGGFEGFGKKKEKTEKDKEQDEKLKLLKYRILENKTCPSCNKKLTLSTRKTHYECQFCGDIIILESYNEPIFNINPTDLSLEYSSNFPINFYLPVVGITIKWLMAEWLAVVIIYAKENPNKKWLRFYAWERNLQQFLKYGYHEAGDAGNLTWTAKRGAGSPNIYEKIELRVLIDSLKKLQKELGWNK